MASAILPEFLTSWAALWEGDPSLSSKIGGNIVIQLEGGDGWNFEAGADPKVSPISKAEATKAGGCVLEASQEVFEALAAKKLNPQIAYLTGKLKVSGDLQLALRTHHLLGAES